MSQTNQPKSDKRSMIRVLSEEYPIDENTVESARLGNRRIRERIKQILETCVIALTPEVLSSTGMHRLNEENVSRRCAEKLKAMVDRGYGPLYRAAERHIDYSRRTRSVFFWNYLRRCVVNSAKDEYRRLIYHEQDGTLAEERAQARDGDDLFRQIELDERLTRALEALGAEQRTAFILRHRQGCTFDIIASCLFCSRDRARLITNIATAKVTAMLE